jgi:serine/threonine protein kinase
VTLASGTRLGPYEITGAIGAGGMGEVFRARDTKLNRDVAIKVLPKSVAEDAERRERFEREALALAALNHPGIVTVYAVENTNDTAFLVMELVEGRPLSDVIPRGGLPLGQLLRIGVSIADAVAAAHQKGVTHRDLKPANIMIGGGEHEGRVKVIDFGLAKGTAATPAGGISQLPTAAATGEGRILGTVAYMSPEQAEGKPIDVRSDLFSLGVILYEMATGVRPFTGDTNLSVLSAIIRDVPKSLTEVNPSLPRDLARIVRRALAKDPEKRYQTAKDLRNDLEELKASLDSGELAAESARSGSPSSGGGMRLWRNLAIGFGVVALALVGTVLVMSRRGDTSTPPPASAASITMTPLTSTGNAELGQISPDGKYVAYVQTDDRQQSVWVRQIASGSTVRILAPSPGLAIWGLTIAPDGSFVDVVRSRAASNTFPLDLWRVPFLGGQPRKTLEDVTSAPGWSPDGTQMAYFTNGLTGGAWELKVSNADGSRPRLISTRRLPLQFQNLRRASKPDLRPAWLPDGQAIAVYGNDESRAAGESQLISVDVATGAPTELHAFGPDHREVTGFRAGMMLGRDGQSVTINLADSGPPQVATVALRTGDVTRLTNDLATYGGVSAAGDVIVTTRYQTSSSLWLSDATGRGARQIGREIPSWLNGLSWAGNTRLVYRATMAGGAGIWSTDLAADAPDLIVPGPRELAASADGRLLVFWKGGDELWRADTDGSHAVRIARGFAPDVAPDGSRMFYLWNQFGVQTVWVLDLAGGEPRQFFKAPVSGLSPPAVSPDGRQVVFGSEGFAVVMPVEGGEPLRRIPMPETRLRWTPDGRGLTYADATNENLWVQPIDGAAPRRLTTFTDGRRIASFAWSPDGKQLALARSVTTSDIVLLKGVR